MVSAAPAMLSDEQNGNPILDGHAATDEQHQVAATTTTTAAESPMKAAADLIQTLDMAYTEMTSCAADAAKDAELARRNARAASEIARRYLTRSYPRVHSTYTAEIRRTASNENTPTRSNLETSWQDEGDGKEDVLVEPVLETIGGSTSTDPLVAINGLAAKLQTPRAYPDPTKHSFKDPSPTRTRTRPYQAPSSADRIAQSHAEDVLALSMELEQTKQALKSEQRMHEETKTALSSHQAKTIAMEEQNKELLGRIEEFTKGKQQRLTDLEQELARSRNLVQAAEEDAQLALDLAKESAEKRDEMEDDLKRAMEEVEALKEQLQQLQQQTRQNSMFETPKRNVRFEDDSTVDAMDFTTPRMTPTPSRSMVAAGRQLLRRSHTSSSKDEVITLEMTPAKSAERRRRLRERLTQLEEDPTNIALAMAGPATPHRSPVRAGGGVEAEACRNTSKLIQESGKRLELNGHWWRKGPSHIPVQEMETMTRQYCQSVEFKIERQAKEINELGSLCNFLEERLVIGTDPTNLSTD